MSQTFYLKLTHDAANQFTSEVGADGVSYVYSQTVTPTLTPTHFGVGWSAWNAASTDGIRQVTFGPVVKVA